MGWATQLWFLGGVMSSDIPLAFDSLDARARSQAGEAPLDRISLRDHVVEVEIGAFQVERGTTQRVAFDVVVEVRPPDAPLDDDVDRILSYDTITEAIAAELAAERLNLLETLAERIAARILGEPRAARVYVRIQKLDRGPGALGVEIVRSSETGPVAAGRQEAVPHPTLVFLANEAIGSRHLTGWIDECAARAQPVILCVGPADVAPPRTPVAAAQRRIDLLAIEQNAWVLAGRDSRCVVVATRTELDWGMRHGQVSVWAPSRLVLDSRDRPPAEAAALLTWFSAQVDAAGVICVGAPPGWTAGLGVAAQDRRADAERLF